MDAIEVLEYENDSGKNAFRIWIGGLSEEAYSKVLSAIALMEAGSLGDVKPVGQGVSERRIHWGPGLRIYFGKDGQKLVILLGGGTKRRQDNDIKSAQNNWAEYKKNKRRT
jgi:putative addiction module killer protein